jgi:hypothetical protein
VTLAASALVILLQAASASPVARAALPAAPAKARAEAPPPFIARFALTPAKARIGDQLTLTIDIDAPASVESVQPRLEETLGDFDVLSIDSTPVTRQDTGWQQRWRVTLAAFDKGEPTVPRFAIDYTAAGGQTLAWWAEPGLSAAITAPQVTAAMPLRPLLGRGDPLPGSPWPRIALIGGILSAVVGVLSVPLVVWWLRGLRRRRQLAYFRQLQRELAKIGDMQARTRAEVSAAYTRAADILRLGVGRVAPGETSSLPTPELANHVARTGIDGARLAPKLRATLAAVDAVRFDDVVPTPHRHSATMGEAGGVVQGMGAAAVKPRPKARSPR